MEKFPLTKEQFDALLERVSPQAYEDRDFLFECVQDAYEGVEELSKSSPVLSSLPINPLQLILYIFHEHQFYLASHANLKKEDLIASEEYERLILSIAVDKYFTNERLAYQNQSFSNRFLPEISTISLYLNFILGILNRYERNNPERTLLVDLLQKSFSLANCITSLLNDGFESEAFCTWRTLHENECILQILVRYGKPVVERYLRHMRYGMAFHRALPKEESDALFEELKPLMRERGLKSKDTKRFIEYGWLYAVPGVDENPEFKLTFRDGVERLANLSEYAQVYTMASEVAHSSPVLIYSRKTYFYLVTMLNLHESFFRLEKLFSSLYLSTTTKEEQERYLAMRNLYDGELLSVYELEKKRLQGISSRKKEEA